MLHPVSGYPALRAAHPDERAFGDIVVDPVDIGVRMMNDVMFLFPDEIISSQGVQRKAHELIDPFTGRIAAVVGVVHHIKPNTGEDKSQDQAGDDPGRGGHLYEQQSRIERTRREDQDKGLCVEPDVACLPFSGLCKIGVDRIFQRGIERGMAVVEAYFWHLRESGF